MFTSDEYRTAAEVVQAEWSENPDPIVAYLLDKAERVGKEEAYAKRIGLAGSTETDPAARGRAIMRVLRDDKMWPVGG